MAKFKGHCDLTAYIQHLGFCKALSVDLLASSEWIDLSQAYPEARRTCTALSKSFPA
jgi:hypothetical protein